MEELASAKRSHNAHKGIFGQRIKTFESRVASFKRSPEVPQNWAEVEDAFDKVKLSYDRLQNAYTEVIIMEHDPGLETQNQAYYTSMEECSNPGSSPCASHGHFKDQEGCLQEVLLGGNG